MAYNLKWIRSVKLIFYLTNIIMLFSMPIELTCEISELRYSDVDRIK